MTTNHGPDRTPRTDWRRRIESLPARWGVTGLTLAVMLGVLMWLVLDNLAVGIALGLAVAAGSGWLGSRRDARRPGPANGPDDHRAA